MDQRSDSETIGFIDVGTNSIHLLVVRFYPDTSGTPVFQDKEAVRLGKSLYSTGVIDEETIAKSALVITRFARISKGLGAERVIALATCAAREAENRQDLIDAVSGEVELKVIPGPEEARLIALGVFGDKGPAERTVEIDIGGGSTEVIVREKGEDIFLDSLSMGAVRYRYGLGIDFSQPVSQEDYSTILRNVDISSYHAVNKVRGLGFRRAVGSSGTLLSLAAMCAARREDGDATYFTRKELHSLMVQLCGMTVEERLSVPGMGKNRADIIIPGGAIAEELMSQFGISRMEVSPDGLKQGMMLDLQLSRGYTVFGARQSSVRALAHRCQYDRRHAETVERNAMSLFDQSRDLGLHSLDQQWRSLLSCACILHDIGELISYANHNVLSQAIIEKADLQGFTCEEITEMGLMVRFHHKKFPGPKDSRFEGMAKEDVRAVRICAMLLKMADVMDRHRNASVRSARLRIEGSRVVVAISADEDPSMELWSLERLSPDFARVFGMPLSPVSADEGRLPAGNGQRDVQTARFQKILLLRGHVKGVAEAGPLARKRFRTGLCFTHPVLAPTPALYHLADSFVGGTHTADNVNGRFERIRRFAFADAPASDPEGRVSGGPGLGPEEIDSMSYDRLCDMYEALSREMRRAGRSGDLRTARRIASSAVRADRRRHPAIRTVCAFAWAALIASVLLMLLYGSGHDMPYLPDPSYLEEDTLLRVAEVVSVNVYAYLIDGPSALFSVPIAISALAVIACRVASRHLDDRVRYGLVLLFLTNGFPEGRMLRVRDMVRRYGDCEDALYYDSIAEAGE